MVLDTNVLVSGFVYPDGIPGKIIALVRSGNIDVIVSRYILDELERVLPRIKTLKMNEDEIRRLINTFVLSLQLVVPVEVQEPDLRDVGDRDILGTLLASVADYLVTGDKDLLALAIKYPIVSPTEFWARHG